MKIVEAAKSDLDAFFSYLDGQLSENGQGETPLFLPMSREIEAVPEPAKAKFVQGFSYQCGDAGWRKLWLAKDESGKIKGHIDLRHHSDGNRLHRVLLGMGVDSTCRKQGLGTILLEYVLAFCQEHEAIDWLDLTVLSDNLPAKNLYLKTGFNIVGEFKDQYRIDGQSVSETAMAKAVKTTDRMLRSLTSVVVSDTRGLLS
ncbi:GNAT family N-acetyltransferase [Oceanospirillum sediminis]|uniref:GNAT family N-acetyltransferase n=1 Tax=Oceanospirillum sediminis TaxID=2760088 RepID=A0A839IW39_9GAMM|nr:N-acetyltransferase [Oceanospirillum sediminis]MBB1488844.1 GNAT family N-acetyltransferase [Oceanospirillum sediminis]